MRSICVKLGLLVISIVIFISALHPNAAQAAVPYSTYSKDAFDYFIYAQSAYQPVAVIGLEEGFNKPQDVFIDDHDHIYVADTGNHRIVHYDERGELVRILDVPESPLKNPHGIFVSAQGDLYIADTGNKRVVRLTPDGKLAQDYPHPESIYLPSQYIYEPVRVVVDRRGFLYIVTKGSYRGLMQLSPAGEFHGFFGNNKTQVSFVDLVKRFFYTAEQLSRQIDLLPSPITSVDIDETGFIYTSTSGQPTESLKKLNISGDNRFDELSFLGAYSFSKELIVMEPDFVDMAVDRNGNITVIDRNHSVVSQYDKEGELLFFWSGAIEAGMIQLGSLHSPVAVDTNSRNELFILDESQHLIQQYRPTYFGQLVHEAMHYMHDGQYAESEALWREIMRLNAYFTPAYEGLALAATSREDYDLAAYYYELAGNREGYSDAFWYIRLGWFQRYFPIVANTVLITAAIVWLLSITRVLQRIPWLRRRRSARSDVKNSPLFLQLRHAFTILKHPLDGFGDLRYDKKGSLLSSFILLACVIISLLFKAYFTSFTFTTGPAGSVEGSTIIIQLLVVLSSWVICNYLISSIYRGGEGRFRDVWIGSVYALFPIVLLMIPVTLLSHGLTLTEGSIYAFLNGVMLVWCMLLFIWKIQATHNYSVGETVVNILLTLLAMLLLWVLIFIIFGLSTEFYRFIYSLIQEVSMR